ncbi:MAG: hypothetical protein ACI9CE_003904, partial [Flavobacterium sp.]
KVVGEIVDDSMPEEIVLKRTKISESHLSTSTRNKCF